MGSDKEKSKMIPQQDSKTLHIKCLTKEPRNNIILGQEVRFSFECAILYNDFTRGYFSNVITPAIFLKGLAFLV